MMVPISSAIGHSGREQLCACASDHEIALKVKGPPLIDACGSKEELVEGRVLVEPISVLIGSGPGMDM